MTKTSFAFAALTMNEPLAVTTLRIYMTSDVKNDIAANKKWDVSRHVNSLRHCSQRSPKLNQDILLIMSKIMLICEWHINHVQNNNINDINY